MNANCCVKGCGDDGHDSFEAQVRAEEKQTFRYCQYHTIYCVVSQCEKDAIENEFSMTCRGGYCPQHKRGNEFERCSENPDPLEGIIIATDSMSLNGKDYYNAEHVEPAAIPNSIND